MTVDIEVVPLEKPDDVNVIVGQSHFIKTVEDLHEALAGVGGTLRFGVAFCEASGARLVRRTGNDDDLVALAVDAALAIGAGHAFVIMLQGGIREAMQAQGSVWELKLVELLTTILGGGLLGGCIALILDRIKKS